MDLLFDAGANAGHRYDCGEGRGHKSIISLMMRRLVSPEWLLPEEQAPLANGRGVEALAKLLHKGKPDESPVEEAFKFWSRQNLTSANGKAGLQILERYLKGEPYCCGFCGTTKRKDVGTNPYLLMCACKSVAYCGLVCQKSAWRAHKKVCGGTLKEDGMAEAIVKKSRDKKGGKKGGQKGGKKGGKK